MTPPSPPTETSPLLASHAINPDDGSGTAIGNGHATASEGAEDVEACSNGANAADSSASPKPNQEAIEAVRKRFPVILPAMAIGVYLSAADQTVIVASYGKIGSDLNALNKTSWIATAYFLTLTSFQPLFGKLSDTFGRKPCLLTGYFIFGLGCLGCGLARNINELIAARAFSGIGGGSMTTVVSIILSDIVPLRERGKWQGYLNIVYGIGAASGAPIGGLLAEISWRYTFAIQAPLCLLAMILVGILLKLPKRDSIDWRTKLKRIDFLGAITMVAAVFFLVLGLDSGSNHGWNKLAISSVCASIPLIAIFLFIEMKVAVEPFAPGHIIFQRGVLPCNFSTMFSFAGWLSGIFYLALYFQAVGRRDPAHAGLLMLPSVLASTAGSLLAGLYMQRTGRYYWSIVIAQGFLVVGLIVIVLCSGAVTSSIPGIIVGMAIAGFSNGVGITVALIALIANVEASDQAVATACFYLFRQLGSVLGLAISATVTNQTLRAKLASALGDNHDTAKIADGVRQSLEYIKTLKPDVQAIVRDCYGRSVEKAFITEAVILVGGVVSAWYILEKSLTR
jgi:MFS family permease